jgi:hypothetical protein
MNPANYASGDPTDLGWITKNNNRSVNNTAMEDTDPTGSISHIGGVHRNVLPCLFADGRVQNIPYTWGYWSNAWAWDNIQAFPLP